MNSAKAYELGWARSKYHDDSAQGREDSEHRFIKRYGGTFVNSWREGWDDAAGYGTD